MMAKAERERSPFKGEWYKCLREHYKHISQTGQEKALLSASPLYLALGFSQDELQQLYIEGTMKLDEPPALPEQFRVHPAECSCPGCMDTVLDIGHDEEGQPISGNE
jgi:hypothetical protein